jgi:hypothetical protein
MIAGKAAGIYDDLAQVAYENSISEGTPVKPDQDRYHQYKIHVNRYIELQETLTTTFRKFSS